MWTMDADGSSVLQISNDDAFEGRATWSGDSTAIAWTADGTDSDVWVSNAGAAAPVNITDDPGEDFEPHWSPTDDRIAFTSTRTGDSEVFTVSSSGADVVNVSQDSGTDDGAKFSPDGQSLAFFSDRSGARGIHLAHFDGSTWSVEADPIVEVGVLGKDLSWSSNGQWIVYVSAVTDPLGDIHIARADGAEDVQLTDYLGMDNRPRWQPVD